MINIDFQSKEAIIQAFPDENSCMAHLEKLRWKGFVTSPFDALSTVYHCSNNRYRCKNTKKYFNAKTGTMFHNSKIELQKWFLAIWIVNRAKRGITSVALAEELHITQKTAWYMLQRIQSQLGKVKKEKKKPVKKAKKAIVVENITVTPEKDRMPMHEWLKTLKK